MAASMLWWPRCCDSLNVATALMLRQPRCCNSLNAVMRFASSMWWCPRKLWRTWCDGGLATLPASMWQQVPFGGINNAFIQSVSLLGSAFLVISCRMWSLWQIIFVHTSLNLDVMDNGFVPMVFLVIRGFAYFHQRTPKSFKNLLWL